MVRGGNAPPLCPGQLLSRSQGLKPEPLGGGGAETSAGVGGESWVEPGFRGAGILETQAPPARTFLQRMFLQRLAALGKVTHQESCASDAAGRGAPKGSPTPPGVRDPQSRAGAKPHPRSPSAGDLIFSQDRVPRVRTRVPYARPNFGKCRPRPWNFQDPCDAPPHSGSRTSGTRYLPPATAGPELRGSCALFLTPELRGRPCHPSIPGS